jgi:DNA primase
VAGGKGLDLRVAAMPEGEDPADMLQAGGLDRFHELVEGAIDLPSFRVRTALGRGDLGSVAGRERTLAEVAPVLAAMGEVVGRDELIREVADRLDTDPSLVSERVRAAPREGSAGPTAAGNGAKGSAPQVAKPPLTPRETRERALLSMCIADPKAGRPFIEGLTDEHLSESGRPALRWLSEHLDDPMAGLPRDDEALTALITELVMNSERVPASEGAMQLNFDLLEQQRLEDSITAAQSAGDYEAGARLSRERAQLTDRIAYAEFLGA